MPPGPTSVSIGCSCLRDYFSATNMKSILRGFVYEYETPKIVTIHSISIALMCRLIQLLILIYGIVYLMIYKKGYQETNTSIISSITLKVKGIGYNHTGENQTLVIDGADYIVPPQENNALFLMSNFIRTDQEHKLCAEAPNEKEAICHNDTECQPTKDYQKANGKWTGRCLWPKNSTSRNSSSVDGLCEIEGWCPVENDREVPNPIHDALNFTIFVKNFIEFPRFKVIRKNIQQDAAYLKQCNYDEEKNKICPIFRVGTLLDIIESDRDEQTRMLKFGAVIRLKIDWKCNLDKPLDRCLPEYTFGRLDARSQEESFSLGFNFRFASHWKHQNRSFRTLTKAFGLRFIISVSGQAGRFDVITLSLNIGSLIGILGLATFICDIVALYVHRQSDVYRQQKFQDVDLNLLQLETLNSLAEGMMSEVAKRKHQAHLEQALLTGHVIGNSDAIDRIGTPLKAKARRNTDNHQQSCHLYNNVSSSTELTNQVSSPSDNYHQQEQTDTASSCLETPSLSSVKQRRLATTAPASRILHFINSSDTANDIDDKTNIYLVDEESPSVPRPNQANDIKRNLTIKNTPVMTNGHEDLNRPSPKLETFL